MKKHYTKTLVILGFILLLFSYHQSLAATILSRTGTSTNFSTVGTYSEKGFLLINTGSVNDPKNLGQYSWTTLSSNTHYKVKIPMPTGIDCTSLGFLAYFQYEYGSYASMGNFSTGNPAGSDCVFDYLTGTNITNKFGQPGYDVAFFVFFDASAKGTDFTMAGDSSTSFITEDFFTGSPIGYGTPAFEISTQSTHNPILIVPGVTGTDILDNSGNKLWLDLLHNLSDIGDQFMDPLQFKSDLTPSDSSLKLGEVIRKKTISVFSFDYTDSLINEFKNQGYIEEGNSNSNLFTFPYDWRYGVSQGNVDLLKSKIDSIRQQTGSDKVDIIAHSTGGLLVKKYVFDHPSDNHINKAVFVGVPNTGAPKAIKVLLQGDNFSIPWLADSEMKKIAQNLPVVYELMPSAKYYANQGSFMSIINQGFLSSNTTDLNFDQTNNLLTQDYSLNSQALNNSHNLHTQVFDDFDLRTAGVDLYAIDGCKTWTMGKVVQKIQTDVFGQKIISFNEPKETLGDGTVPFESSNNLPIDTSKRFYSLKGEHSKLMSADGSRQEIVNILSGSSLLVDGNKITQDISKCQLNGKAISIYSPLSIDVVDQDGNHSGIASDGSIFNDIPNADVEIFGDHKFIYFPNDGGQTYNINLSGTDNGTFTLKDETISSGNTISSSLFTNIPVNPNLKGSLVDGSTPSLNIDTDGDGIKDITLNPNSTITGDALYDNLAPTTSVQVFGLSGATNFYSSNVNINLSSVDNADIPLTPSGVYKIFFNLDDNGYLEYQNQITVSSEGLHNIKFFAVDNAGNNEQEQTLSFTIDKTSPEFNIYFDQNSKDLFFSGIDNISRSQNIIISDQDNIIGMKDEAGNTTQIILKDKDRKHILKAEIKSLLYNNVSTDISRNDMIFDWKLDKQEVLKGLHQRLKNKKDYNIEATYDGLKTTISGKDQTGKVNKILNGLVLLKVSTNKGDFNWGY